MVRVAEYPSDVPDVFEFLWLSIEVAVCSFRPQLHLINQINKHLIVTYVLNPQ